MKRLILLILALLLIASCSQNEPSDTISQDDTVQEPEPQTEPSFNECSPSDKKSGFCIEIYEPVCGSDEQTYSNSCFACQSENVAFWTEGECSNEPKFFSKIDGEKIVIEFVENLEEYATVGGISTQIINSSPGPKRCADCWTYIIEYETGEETYEVVVEHTGGKASLVGEVKLKE